MQQSPAAMSLLHIFTNDVPSGTCGMTVLAMFTRFSVKEVLCETALHSVSDASVNLGMQLTEV